MAAMLSVTGYDSMDNTVQDRFYLSIMNVWTRSHQFGYDVLTELGIGHYRVPPSEGHRQRTSTCRVRGVSTTER